jgi:hypothetical protein
LLERIPLAPSSSTSAPDYATIGANLGELPHDPSVLKLRSRDKFPDVRWWTQKDYSSKTTDTLNLDADDETDDKQKGFPWVEDRLGNSLDSDDSTALSTNLPSVLGFVGSKGRLADKWSQADVEVIDYVLKMYTEYPDLRLCSNHWKLTMILTKTYPSWIRNYRRNVTVKTEATEARLPSEAPEQANRKHKSSSAPTTSSQAPKRRCTAPPTTAPPTANTAEIEIAPVDNQTSPLRGDAELAPNTEIPSPIIPDPLPDPLPSTTPAETSSHSVDVTSLTLARTAVPSQIADAPSSIIESFVPTPPSRSSYKVP